MSTYREQIMGLLGCRPRIIEEAVSRKEALAVADAADQRVRELEARVSRQSEYAKEELQAASRDKRRTAIELAALKAEVDELRSGTRCPSCLWALYDGEQCQNRDCANHAKTTEGISHSLAVSMALKELAALKAENEQLRHKADQWDALGYVPPYVMPTEDTTDD